MSPTRRKRTQAASLAAACKKPPGRSVVVMDDSGVHSYSLSPESLGGLHAALDELAGQGWLPVLLAYELLKV
jgi:hypothetical protein